MDVRSCVFVKSKCITWKIPRCSNAFWDKISGGYTVLDFIVFLLARFFENLSDGGRGSLTPSLLWGADFLSLCVDLWHNPVCRTHLQILHQLIDRVPISGSVLGSRKMVNDDSSFAFRFGSGVDDQVSLRFFVGYVAFRHSVTRNFC